MLLTKLLQQDAFLPNDYNPDITGITSDSRQVQKGFAFIALPGSKTNGSQFIEDALKAGAHAIISLPDVEFSFDPEQVAHIVTPTPRLLLSRIASRFYARQPHTITAVTGTNGKTSTAHFCRMIWQLLDLPSASIGTIGVIDKTDSFAKENTTSLTTPDPVMLHRILAELSEKDIQHVAMEASSHGLDQCRLDGVRIQAAAFTNLSRDHLDYHHSYANYLQAKTLLFSRVMQQGGIAVLNADIPEYPMLAELCHAQNHTIMSYGWHGETLRLHSIIPLVSGQQVTFSLEGKEYRMTLALVGEFQVMNILCALGLVIACGADKEKTVAVLEHLPSVPGRMEKVPTPSSDTAIFVDYAHTPDALTKALEALRPHTEHKLLVVFGCGGDRDKGKRPQMGTIASHLADTVIITDDNPRTEDPATIRCEIKAGCPGGTEIADRGEAIRFAINSMHKGDILLIAGKGHEKIQIMKDGAIPFDDVAIASQIAKELNI